MNRKLLALVSLLIGAAGSSPAVSLQFTNISVALLPGLTNRLAAVAYGGSSNFVAVGEQGTFVRGLFTPNEPLLALANWNSGSAPSGGSNLLAVASSGSLFVASGLNNRVFSSSDGVTWGTNYFIFTNTATTAALAYNGGNFVAVAKAPEISWTAVPPLAANWPTSTIANLSFLESYRGVTPYGDNGFAACGIFGTVRVSTNAGRNWQTNHGGIGKPDLLGIATAGTSLVAVGKTIDGTNGVILVSTNSGANWQTNYTNPANNTPLYAAANLGSGFLAAGQGGTILTSPDGLVWTPVPAVSWRGAAATTQDLFGVTFATGGYMKEVGVLVGANGTVILAGPPPPPPVSLGDKLWCAGYPNPPLVVSVTNSVGTNVVTVDWFAVPSGGAPLTNTSVSYTAPTQVANANSTNTYWAEARDLRTGFVSTNRTPVMLTIHQRPTAEIISTNSICNGAVSTITVKFKTGNPPWNLTFTDGFSNYVVSADSATLNYDQNFTVYPTNVFLNEATNWIYRLIKLTDTFCEADTNTFPADFAGQGQVTVYPRPTATVSGTTAICNGYSTDVHAALTGIGPWNVTWSSNGIVVGTHTGVASTTDALTVSPVNPLLNAQVTATYTVTALTDAHCTANENDLSGSAVITVNPRPTTTLVSLNRTNCNDGSAYTILADLTGLGPWAVTWWDGAVSNAVASPAIRTVYPTNTLPSAPVYYSYWVESLADTNCTAVRPWGDFTGTNVVRVNPRPTTTLVSLDRTNCNDGSAYVIQAALTGLGPWAVTWWDGAVSNVVASPGSRTVYPTNLLANTETNYFYWVQALADTNCTANQPGDLMGTNMVRVNPRPTAALVSLNRTNCNDGSAYTIQADLTGLGPWNVTWYDGAVSNVVASPAIRTVYPTNLLANAATNYSYWVQALADAYCTADQPGDLTGTNVVRVNPRPTATLVSLNRTNCNDGSSYTIQAALTGLGPWAVTWWDGAVSNVVVSPATRTEYPTNTVTSAPVYYSYWVAALTDTQCTANQPGDLTGTNVVRVNPRPTAKLVSLDETRCNNGSNYIVQADLTGLGPWTVTWWDGAVSNVVVSPASRTVYPTNQLANAATNRSYWVQALADAYCTANQPGDLTGTNVVHIDPRPTATLVTTNTICNGVSTDLHVNLTGLGPWTVWWADGWVDTTNAAPGSPVTLVRSVTPANPLPNNETNYAYWVTAVSNATSCLGDFPGDIRGTNRVIVNPRPTAALVSVDQTICNGATNNLFVNLTGLGPWTVHWADGATQTTNVAAGNSITLVRPVNPANPLPNDPTNYTYWVLSVSNNATACQGNQPGDITGTNTVTVNPRPTATLVSASQTVCYGGAAELRADLTGIGPEWTVTWSDDFVQTTNGSPLVRSVSPGNVFTNLTTNYTFWIKSVSNVTSCVSLPGDVLGTNVVTVMPRLQAWAFTVGTNGDLTTNICNGSTTLLQVRVTGIAARTLKWTDGYVTNTISADTNTFKISITPVNSLVDQPTNYTYSVIELSDTNGCLGELPTNNVAVTVYSRPTATLAITAGDTNVCTAGTNVIHADLAGLAPFNVIWTIATNNTVAYVTNTVATNYDELVMTLTNDTATTVFTNLFSVSVTDATSTNGCPPFQTANVAVTVYPLLSAVVTPEAWTMGTNENKTISVALTGVKPWMLMWDDGTNQSNILSSPATRVIYGTNIAKVGDSATYTLTNVTDNGSPCPTPLTTNNTATFGLVASNFLAKVEGGIHTTNALCVGDCYAVSVSLTNWQSSGHTYGSPWRVTFSDTHVTNVTNGSGSVTFAYTVCPTSNTTITVASVTGTRTGHPDQTIGLSPNLIGGGATILVNPLPTAHVTTTNHVICLGDSISIGALLTGKSPWIVTWSDGVAQPYATPNAVYVVTPSSNFTYTVTSVTDNNGCAGTNLTGSAAVTLTNCAPLAISLGTPPTNVILSWGANRWLQSADGLLNPPAVTVWSNLPAGGGTPGTRTSGPTRRLRVSSSSGSARPRMGLNPESPPWRGRGRTES